MNTAQRVAGYGKWLIAVLLACTGVLSLLRRLRARRGEVPVLLLHRVSGSARAPEPLAIPPAIFRRLVTAAARRYAIASWDDCAANSRRRIGRPHLALTLDDGYSDNARHAWPILRAAGATATFFITTGFAGGTEVPWWEVAAACYPAPSTPLPGNGAGERIYGDTAEVEIKRLKRMPHPQFQERVTELKAGLRAAVLPADALMHWNELRQLLAEGAKIGAHSVTHPILSNCSDAQIAAEMRGCREQLRSELACDVDLFAYPNGECDARLQSFAAAAGYRFAFTAERRWFNPSTDPLRVPRIAVRQREYSPDGVRFSWTLFEAELLGVMDVLLLRRWRRQQSRPAAE